VKDQQVHELLYQAFETELGGVQVYERALDCVRDDDLREEWSSYHEQTRHHVELLEEVLHAYGLDPSRRTPGRDVVQHLGASLVEAIERARKAGDAAGAELVAAECVVLAETKDHLNWELLAEVASAASGERAEALRAAVAEVEDEEDEHLYHTMGWTRELWMSSLGMPAVLPPPEEQKEVKTAIGAARAKQARSSMM